ncbi:MAG: hypothetical protein K2N51_10045 [Lachnospiraceae bacterium]|nr:hypothetical protein [Lachnospiraceae bacterium]
MIDISIEKKDYDAVCYKATGREIKNDVAIYNRIFFADIEDKNDMFFFVYSNRETLEPTPTEKRKEFNILGLFHGRQILSFGESVRYIYIVELFDDEVYYQNNRSGKLKGKVREVKRYNFNFEFKDYIEKKKSTYLDLLDFAKCNMDNCWAERYAITRFNIRLFSNICKYKKKSITEYEDKFEILRRDVEKRINPNNLYREELKNGLKILSNICELSQYIQKNRSKFLDKSEKLYKKDDNVKNSYFDNMAGRNVSLILYDGLLFNSAMPFYYQYRNYKYATQILSEIFFTHITLGEEERINQEIAKLKCLCMGNKMIEQRKVDTKLYGLYFPVFMNFRQSVELAYKLIFVNEDLKKQILNTQEEVQNYVKRIDTHDLIKLLELIEPYLEEQVFEYLWNLTSFIHYNEGTDSSFSRYLIDIDFNLDDFRKIYINYMDLYNYIQEFYPTMDDLLTRMQLGFDMDNIY